ncbi:phosphomannomutase/phosphoglucomutase [Wolbachia endosymbiont of Pentidionis agamae]|uniref:phosphomannomutase/phosphoglucomutase n=1 Tax=Wolbachia endosymbiont of Pentidionis agamae TaxID=3110435 RepID=UPI002FD78245
MDNTIIRKYDIRGIVGKNLKIQDGYEIGRKFAQFLGSNKSVCVGYDSRVHSPSIEKKLIEGLRASGVNVICVGLCSSPMLYFATKITRATAGIMVTASHNPPQYNGFKFFSNNKVFLDQEIKEILSADIRNHEYIGSLLNVNIYNRYINMLKSLVRPSSKKLKIAWDCSNGPISGIMRYIEQVLPSHEHIVINNVIDGAFPIHDPDPTEKKNLCQLIDIVKINNCDIGIALDGDGDRVCLIDSSGNVVLNDYLFMIFVQDILEKYPGSKIIANVKMSMEVHNLVNRLEGKALICATGHSLIKKKMMEEDAKFAGELSGHFFFSELGFDDGLYAAIKIINILLKNNQILSEVINNLPELHITNEIKIIVEDDKKFEAIESVKKALKQKNIQYSDIDGVKVTLENGKGWWLLRASNTQNCITARCEGRNNEDFEYVQKILSGWYRYLA